MIEVVELAAIAMVGLYVVLLGLGHVIVPSFLAQNRLTVIAGIVLVIGAFDGLAMMTYWKTPTLHQAILKTEGHLLPSVMAKLLRMKLKPPHPINDRLWIEDIEARSETLVYNISVKAENSTEFNSLVSDFTYFLYETGCGQPEYAMLLNHGIAIEIDMYTSGQWQAAPFIMTPQACGIM